MSDKKAEWSVYNDGNLTNVVKTGQHNKVESICTVFQQRDKDGVFNDEHKANAKLIAAAPELLKVVQDFQEAFVGKVTMKPEPEHLEWFVSVTKRMNEVIEKATA